MTKCSNFGNLAYENKTFFTFLNCNWVFLHALLINNLTMKAFLNFQNLLPLWQNNFKSELKPLVMIS